MLRDRLEEHARSRQLLEALDLLQELVAYVMQTGPKGGKFYYTPKGRKIYRTIRRREAQRVLDTDEDRDMFDREWDRFGMGVGGRLRRVFGSKAPSIADVQRMFGDPSTGLKATVDSVVDLWDGGVRFNMKLTEANGQRVDTEYTREFRMEQGKPYAYHDFLELDEKYQGGGRAGALFESTLKGYERLGIERVDVFAALTAGPYVWAKFGFQPQNQREARMLEEGFREFATRSVRDGGYGLKDEAVDKILEKVLTPLGDVDAYKLASVSLNGKTPDGTLKKAELGKDFFLNGKDGGPFAWHGQADLTSPKTKERWKRQAAKGAKRRKAAFDAGTADRPLSDEQLARMNAQWRQRRMRFTGPDSQTMREIPRFGVRSQPQWAERRER